MEHWQFLIQKQGDRSWYPLESPNTEIKEGRYRVLARSSLPNTDVEVRVIHLSTQEVPPKRRIQKRLRRTNSEGLMAVIPYTYLKSGMWELRCSGDLMSDMLGQSWQYGVYLQVMSQQVYGADGQLGIEDDSESISLNSSELSITQQKHFVTTDSDQEALIDQPVSPVWVKGETAEQILQNLIDLALPSSANLLEDETKVEDTPTPQASLPLSLRLDKETYITRWGHVLTIHGCVELEENSQHSQDSLSNNLYALELSIELRSPLSSEILTQIRQTLTDKSLPFSIRSTIDIPADCESKLILADINLYGAFTKAGKVVLLAKQSFTITADVTELLAVTAAQSQAVEIPEEPSTATTSTAEAATNIDLELFNLVKTQTSGKSQPLSPAPNKPLPEQIDQISLKKSTDSRGLQLPKLPETPTDAASADLVTEITLATPVEQDEAIVPTIPAPINLEQLVIKNRRGQLLGRTFPYLKPLSSVSSTSESMTDEVSEGLDVQVGEDLLEINVPIIEDENTPAVVSDDIQSADDQAVAELEASPTLELSDEPQTEMADTSSQERIDDSVSQPPIPPSFYSSPLIRKWMQSQGYSLPELADTPYLDTDNDVVENQTIPDEVAGASDVEVSLPSPDAVIVTVEMATVVAEELENQEDEEAQIIALESSALVPVSEESPVEQIKTPLAWLAEEIVVDDIYNEPDVDLSKNYGSKADYTAITDVFSSPDITGMIIEPLPIPQLHVPEGELIAGNSIRVRVELPEVAAQVAVKLWVEDCQTRWLLDGPHLLKDLLPNTSGGVEVMIQLNIPFGCLEIRIEAIALNLVTQQESHKVTVMRTVIPPDLPSLQLDELFGL
ncbi:hypothetical protein Nos7524_3570 [Nostoc sp. PCC 7524]|uniref:hypothetical protein n=1 Tax=Nostoc sp. (strain ATCC 29411 / PCC 7524) TaxID=28072 RepID=UPI00029F4502|nr:hypothetical protein [Nostoc sp. PCC 7524]AFY49361.1 hypothetical protein Nos7524_3570 [Nostoc sp. PCC 7524]